MVVTDFTNFPEILPAFYNKFLSRSFVASWTNIFHGFGQSETRRYLVDREKCQAVIGRSRSVEGITD